MSTNRWEVVWADKEKQILHQIFKPGWSRSDVVGIITKTKEMAETQDHPVHIIMDFSRARLDTPMKLSSLARPIEDSVPKNQHLLYVVGANKYIELMMVYSSMLAPKASRNRTFTQSAQEAIDNLKNKGIQFTLVEDFDQPDMSANAKAKPTQQIDQPKTY